MSALSYLNKSESPRALIVSLRLIIPSISRCLVYEFEDLICKFDSVDIVAPTAAQTPSWWRNKFRRAIQRSMGDRWASRGSSTPYVDQKYELLLIAGESLQDLHKLDSLPRWLATSRVRVCYLQEIWAEDIAKRTGEIALLRQFDLIFVSCQGSVSQLTQATGRPCAYLAPGVDAISFCPLPNPPARVIDLYSMGRRSSKTHQALIQLAKERDFFYLYDTKAGNVAKDVTDHRLLLGQLVKRTRYFLANSAKADVSDQTKGQEEVGTRFFEASAGGVVMIGQAPQCPTFKELFGWPDAVVPLPYDSVDIVDVIDELDGDSSRVHRIRKANVGNALRRHDWVYRWEEILKAAGMKSESNASERKNRLEELAATVEESENIIG